MKPVKLLTLAALTVLLGVVGCGPSSAPTSKAGTEGIAGGEVKGDLDVACFQGGFGIDFYQAAAQEFEKEHPGVHVKVDGNPRIWEQLRPRFVSGNVPDLTYPGWGMDHWSLIYEDQLMPLDKALDSPAADGKGTWRDTFEPSLLKLGQYNGKQYVLPYFFNVLGWWYDPNLFAKNGWTPPKTYEELLTLCAKIKAKGIAPITYQGKYPYYLIAGFLYPWALSAGGQKAIDDAQNLVPGAWKSPAMLKAASMIRELRDKGYFQEGAIGMSHTESQTEFLRGKAAMIPCGTWLYSEMSKVMPPTAKMDFMLPPVLSQGQGDPTAVSIGIEPWMIPSKAKNPSTAIAFFKYLTSLPKAKQFVEAKGTLMGIKGSDQAKLPDHLKQAAKAFRDSKTVWAIQYREWYPAFEKDTEDAMTALLNGEATPQQFCDRCEAAAEKQRQDKNTPRHTVVH